MNLLKCERAMQPRKQFGKCQELEWNLYKYKREVKWIVCIDMNNEWGGWNYWKIKEIFFRFTGMRKVYDFFFDLTS